VSEDINVQMAALAEKYLTEQKFSSAEVVLQKILQSDSEHARANELLAYLLSARGELDLAFKYLSTACSSPDCSYQALYNLGNYFLANQKYLESADYISRSLKKGGNFFEGLHDLGLTYIGLKKFGEAAQYLRSALDLNPDSFEALNNLGAALRNLGELSESLKYLDAAIKIKSDDAGAWLNKGVTLDTMGDFGAALHSYDRALQITPSYLEAICNKANTMKCMGRYEEAEVLYIEALELSPQDADSHYNHAHLCLLNGDFKLGWEKFEARWHSTDAPAYLPGTTPLLTSIDHLNDKKILVWAEQGLGDTIQFCRYIVLLRNLGARVTLLVQPALIELLKNLEGVEKIEGEHINCATGCDFQIPMMSLPLLFKTNLSSIPVNIPYICADLEKTRHWNKRTSQKKKLKVGLVWSGGFRKDLPALWSVNNRRNIPFAQIAPLQHIEDVDFYSLQKGEPAESEFLVEGHKFWTRKNLINLTHDLHDFSDTAALIANLDLIITVDTSTAHLAAAMGKPVWILNRFDACWRWLNGRIDSPWYPTVRLYNQVNSGDWTEVMRQVAFDLRELVAKPPDNRT